MEENIKERFWLVFWPNDDVLPDQFNTIEEAEVEANRRARKHIGEPFYIMEAVKVVGADEPTPSTEITTERVVRP